jgi:hypothetical protein
MGGEGDHAEAKGKAYMNLVIFGDYFSACLTARAAGKASAARKSAKNYCGT